LFSAFQPLINTVIRPLIGIATKHLPAIGKAINEFVTDLFDENKRKAMFDKMIDKLGDILATLFRAVFSKIFDFDARFERQRVEANRNISGLQVSGEFAGMTPTDFTSAQPQSPLTNQPPSRSLGSFGATGNAFENFGSGTPIIAHDVEGVFKPEHITQLMRAGTSNALEGLVSQLNNTQAEMNRTLREIADYSRRNVDATTSLSGNAFA
jgi:hypothetical protein